MVIKSPGRPVSRITPDFFVRTPTQTMAALAAKKNKGFTWQELADKLGDISGNEYSPIYVYRVTKGELDDTPSIRRALGLEKPYPPYKKILPTDPGQVQRQIEKYMPEWELVRKEK